MISGRCEPSRYAPANIVGDMSALNEPRRPIAKDSPVANASDRPEKYCTIATSVHIRSVSAPEPNSRRPAAMPTNEVLNAVSTAPARQAAAVPTVMRAAPKRSTSMPPTSNNTMLGRLYMALSIPIWVLLNDRSRCSKSATGPMESYT